MKIRNISTDDLEVRDAHAVVKAGEVWDVPNGFHDLVPGLLACPALWAHVDDEAKAAVPAPVVTPWRPVDGPEPDDAELEAASGRRTRARAHSTSSTTEQKAD